MVSVFALFAVLHHGKDAIIKAGTPFTAYLDSSSVIASTFSPAESDPRPGLAGLAA